MCGIAGYYQVDVAQGVLEQMCKLLEHRGPDGAGLFEEPNVGLAHRRLSIIDIEGGAQPMFSADQRYVLVYNGEVYNYLELKAELQAAGYSFTTNSDTEVVLQAFAAWGTSCFDRFNGMFGLAIYDREQNRLVLARDHFGIKPVYYAELAGAATAKNKASLPGLVFASEIIPIFKTGLLAKQPDDRTVYRYLQFRVHEDSNSTFFDGVKKLMPGQMLVADSSGITVSHYTNLPQELLELANQQIKYSDASVEEFKQQFITSVKLRLQSDVPVGTSLSGGLDSSSVAVVISDLMSQHESSTKAVGASQNVFSAVFPNSINDEEKYVDSATAACTDLAVHKIKPTADEFKQDITEFIIAQEEPLISTGPYAQFKVMQEATRHVKVLLDGQGADEIMAGYIPYYMVYLRELKEQKRYGKYLAELFGSLDVLLRLARFRIKDKLLFKKAISFKTFLNPDFAGKYASEKYIVERSNLKKRLLADLFHDSIPSLLRYEDKNTMHFSIEGRVPFLDKELIKYLFSLDNDAIIKGGWNKRILRDSMTGLLPDLIRKRRNKIGFTTPEEEWFTRLKSYFYDLFVSSSFGSRPYFNQAAVIEAFEAFIANRSGVPTMDFWRLANVELWLRAFFDEPEPPKVVKASDFEPNLDKNIILQTADANTSFARYPLRTDLVSADSDLAAFVSQYAQRFFAELPSHPEAVAQIKNGKWFLYISEKIVAITQGRSYFIWDINPSWWAKTLSRFVSRTPAGIGLGSPYTMHLAIQEVGLGRILYASVVGGAARAFGKRGLFYELAGHNVRAIDGPTEYSVYPANVSAKLAPAEPDKVSAELSAAIRAVVPEPYLKHFAGVVVIDSNDIGRNILGTDISQVKQDLAHYEAAFGDNPLGQADEQTPLCIVVEN